MKGGFETIYCSPFELHAVHCYLDHLRANQNEHVPPVQLQDLRQLHGPTLDQRQQSLLTSSSLVGHMNLI